MSATTALDGLLDPLGRCLDAESARRLVELRVSPPVQQRIDTLAERANEGVLTSDESAEYEALVNAADFISILKLKARQQLRPMSARWMPPRASFCGSGQPAVVSTACSARNTVILPITLNTSSPDSTAAPTMRATWRWHATGVT